MHVVAPFASECVARWRALFLAPAVFGGVHHSRPGLGLEARDRGRRHLLGVLLCTDRYGLPRLLEGMLLRRLRPGMYRGGTLYFPPGSADSIKAGVIAPKRDTAESDALCADHVLPIDMNSRVLWRLLRPSI